MAVYNPIKLTALPASPVPNAVYYIKSGSDTRVKLYVTDSAGTAFPVGILTEQDILDTELAGYSLGTNTSLASTDSILNAFRKVQGQINSLSSAVAGGIKVPDPIDCSTNPNYPVALAGDSYLVTVAGKIGGSSGIAVQVGDKIVALTDNGGGTQAAVGSQWFVIQGNVDKATESVDGLTRIATEAEANAGSESFAYVTPLRLRGGVRSTPLLGYTVGANTALAAGDSILAAFGKVQGQINAKQNSLGFTPENVANKSTAVGLGTSNTLYPTQNAVKSYVDTGLAGKENAFSKNTGFNKNFGTVADTVAQGNDSRFHAALTLGTANGLSLTGQQLSLDLASTSATGALSSTDWNTFNNKQNSLTNPVTGTGTTNFLPKFTGLSTIGNSQIFELGGNVGIGTITPNSKLHIQDRFPLRLQRSGTSQNGEFEYEITSIYGLPDGSINFIKKSGEDNSSIGFRASTSGFVQLSLLESGNVGIGTATPSSNLEVRGTINSNYLRLSGDDDDGGRGLDFTSFLVGTRNGAGHQINAKSISGTITFATFNTERLRITSTGNVGIGTTSPSERLDVDGNVRIRIIANALGDYATLSGTGVVTKRTPAQVRTEIVTWTEIGW